MNVTRKACDYVLLGLTRLISFLTLPKTTLRAATLCDLLLAKNPPSATRKGRAFIPQKHPSCGNYFPLAPPQNLQSPNSVVDLGVVDFGCHGHDVVEKR